MTPPDDAIIYVFDPHVVWAVLALCIAVFVLVLLSAIPIDDRRKPPPQR